MTNVLDIQVNSTQAESRLGSLSKANLAAQASFLSLSGGIDRIGASLLRVIPQIVALGSAFIGLGALTQATSDAREFNAQFTELSTIAGLTTRQLRSFRRELRTLSRQYGISELNQASASYQAFSSGITDASDNLALLRAANELAVAGYLDTRSAVDLLTSAINAFGLDAGDSAGRLNDLIFTTVRLGRTTVPELRQALAQVLPIANAAGVSLENLLSGVVGLTASGISTQQSATQLRSFIQTFINTPARTQEIADRIGVDLSTTVLNAVGFPAFVQMIIDGFKAVGVEGEALTQSLAEFFPGVESLIPALVFSGTGRDTTNNALIELADAEGATKDAVELVQMSLDGQISIALNTIDSRFQELGQTLLEGLVPVLNLIADRFELIRNIVTVATTGAAFSAGGRFGSNLLNRQSLESVGRQSGTVFAPTNLGRAAAVSRGLGPVGVGVGAGIAINLALEGTRDELGRAQNDRQRINNLLTQQINRLDNLNPAIARNRAENVGGPPQLGFSQGISEPGSSQFRLEDRIAEANRRTLVERRNINSLLDPSFITGDDPSSQPTFPLPPVTGTLDRFRNDQSASAFLRGNQSLTRPGEVNRFRSDRIPVDSRNPNETRVPNVTDEVFTQNLTNLREERARDLEIDIGFEQVFRDQRREGIEEIERVRLESVAEIGRSLADGAAARLRQGQATQRIIEAEITSTEILNQVRKEAYDNQPLVRYLNSLQNIENGTQNLTNALQGVVVNGFDSVGSSISRAIFQGERFQDTLRDIARTAIQALADIAIQRNIVQPFVSGVSSFFGGSAIGDLFGFGDAPVPVTPTLATGPPVGFASGGLISGRRDFTFGNGQRGMAGEQGPEFIIPAVKGPNGDLGIQGFNGPSGGGMTVTVVNNLNVTGSARLSAEDTRNIASMMEASAEKTVAIIEERAVDPNGYSRRQG